MRCRPPTTRPPAQALTPIITDGWSLATALSLLVWFIYAPQCISTLATIKRETNSWKQIAIATGYLFALAYLASLRDLPGRGVRWERADA